MSASLVEMVVAIALAGVIFAGALVPVTQVVVAYQESEADLQRFTAQNLGGLRIAQLTASLWREADPPTGHDVLNEAKADRLAIGSWEISAAKSRLFQDSGGKSAAAIAEPVEKFAFTYLLDNGKSTKSLSKAEFDQFVALRYQWIDTDGATYIGLVVPTDRTFAGEALELPSTKPPKVYRRANYVQQIKLSVKPWK